MSKIVTLRVQKPDGTELIAPVKDVSVEVSGSEFASPDGGAIQRNDEREYTFEIAADFIDPDG
jgi:hypothetical protein